MLKVQHVAFYHNKSGCIQRGNVLFLFFCALINIKTKNTETESTSKSHVCLANYFSLNQSSKTLILKSKLAITMSRKIREVKTIKLLFDLQIQ